MNEDLIRLSEFVPAHARSNGVSTQAAAYDLKEMIDALSEAYYVSLGASLPERVCWVGGVTTSRRSSKSYMIDFESLASYFETWVLSPEDGEPSFQCFCKLEREYRVMPASSVYFSKNELAGWIQAASAEIPAFLANQVLASSPGPSREEIKAFQGKELVSIRGLARGLIDLIVAVDRAHRGLPDKTKAAAILRAASQLDMNERASKWRAALVDLADAAEVEDFRRSRQTLDRYIGKI